MFRRQTRDTLRDRKAVHVVEDMTHPPPPNRLPIRLHISLVEVGPEEAAWDPPKEAELPPADGDGLRFAATAVCLAKPPRAERPETAVVGTNARVAAMDEPRVSDEGT